MQKYVLIMAVLGFPVDYKKKNVENQKCILYSFIADHIFSFPTALTLILLAMKQYGRSRQHMIGLSVMEVSVNRKKFASFLGFDLSFFY